jgi:hypothetical protein
MFGMSDKVLHDACVKRSVVGLAGWIAIYSIGG